MLGFENLLDWLTELKEVLYLLSVVYYKGCNPGRANWKRDRGQVVGEGHRAPVHSEHVTLTACGCFLNPFV